LNDTTTIAPTLAEQRAAAQSALVGLEMEQGRCWLDGKPFDPALIDAQQAEIAAIDAAEAETVRRERAAQAAQWASQRDDARKVAAIALATHDAALERVRDSVKELVADIGVMQAAAATMALQCNRMGIRPPDALTASHLTVNVSRLLAGELMAIGGRTYFGHLKWPSVSAPDWADYTARLTSSLNPIIEGTSE
jgi:hypothetical protein